MEEREGREGGEMLQETEELKGTEGRQGQQMEKQSAKGHRGTAMKEEVRVTRALCREECLLKARAHHLVLLVLCRTLVERKASVPDRLRER